MDARPIMPRYQIPLTDIVFFRADQDLITQAQAATNRLLLKLKERISPEILQEFKIEHPKCVLGTIGTGDQFIYDHQRTETILLDHPKTLAVGMEGGAVAQVCADYNVPFVVIRTISDKADHTSQLSFPRFIDAIARYYSEHIILEMLK